MLKMNKPTPVKRVGYTASNSVPHSMKITVEQELPFNARTLKVLVNKELPLNNGISIGSDKATGIIDSKHVVRVLEGVNIADALMVMLHRETKQMHGEVIEAHECIHTDKAQVFAKVAEAELSASNAKASELKAKQSETNAANSASSALTSKNAAKLSETNAANSEQAAKESELAAQESEETALVHRTHALESKTAAKVSETNAKASELAAKASETQANASATTATNEASKAATSASAALASETNAKKSETNAKASELAADADAKQVAVDRVATAQAMEQTEQYKDAASLSASNAAASEASALASKNAAKTSETNALASKNSAASSASLAQSKATEAGTYADSASASAVAAKASETNAKNSEINAGTSASAAGSDASIAAEKAATAIAKADEANASANVAVEAAKRAETAMAAISGALVEMGFCDLSGGVYPTPLTDTNGNKHSCFWKVTKGGTVNGVVYGVGDSLVFSVELNDYYKIDNTESVTSVNGKQGAVTINAEDVGAYSKSQVPTWVQVGLKSGGKFRAVGKTDGGSEQTDPNTLDLSGAGFHQKLTHEVNENAPRCGTGYSYIQQLCYGTSGNATQIAYPYGTANNNGKIGYRTKYGEVWNPWEYLYSTANKPTWEDVGGTAYIKADSTYLQIGQAKWLRAGGASYGFLPSQAGKYTEAKSSLGSSTWWFANAFVNNYRGGNISVDKYLMGAWTLDEHSNGNLELRHGTNADLALYVDDASKDVSVTGALYEQGNARVYSTANKPTHVDVGAINNASGHFITKRFQKSNHYCKAVVLLIPTHAVDGIARSFIDGRLVGIRGGVSTSRSTLAATITANFAYGDVSTSWSTSDNDRNGSLCTFTYNGVSYLGWDITGSYNAQDDEFTFIGRAEGLVPESFTILTYKGDGTDTGRNEITNQEIHDSLVRVSKGAHDFSGQLKESGERVYSPNNKPAPDEIGAYPKPVVDSLLSGKLDNDAPIIQNPDALFAEGKTVIGRTSTNVAGLSGVRSLLHLPNGKGGFQLAARTQDSEFNIRVAGANDGVIGEWERIYTTGYKPTANDVQALPISGGKLSGKLAIQGGTTDQVLELHAATREGQETVYQAYFNKDGSVRWGYDGFTSHDSPVWRRVNSRANGKFSFATSNTSDYQCLELNGKKVYNEGFKPTALDVGAQPKLDAPLSTRYYKVSATVNPELLNAAGKPLESNASYLVRLSTTSTGSVTGSLSVVEVDANGVVEVYLIATNGSSSNHPRIKVVNGKAVIYTNHTNEYTVMAMMQEVATSSPNCAFLAERSYYSPFNKPTASDVGSYSKGESDSRFVNIDGDTMTGGLQINGLHSNTPVAADAIKASGYGIMANRAVMYLQNASPTGKVGIGVGGEYGKGLKLSVGASLVESFVPMVVKGNEVSVVPSAASDASIHLSTAANKNCTIRMREDANKHGGYIQYDGATSNSFVVGTYQDGSSTMAISIPRGKPDVNFENNIYVKGGQVNLVNKFKLIGETNGVKINSVTHGKNAWFGARNTSWFHIETDATSGFYSYSPFEFSKGINVHSDVGIKIAGKEAVKGDSWLRLNPSGQFSSGIYFGSVGVVRTDNQLHVGDWTNQNKTAKVNKDFYDTTWGGNGIAAYNLRCSDSTGAHWAFASYYDATNIRSGIQILSDATGKMRFYTNRRSNYVELHSGNVFAGAGQSNAANAYTRKDYVDSKVASLGRAGEVAIGSNAPRAAADSIGISGQVWGCKDWSGKYQDPFGLATYVSITDGFRITSTGYYELEWTAYRRSHGSDSVCKSAIGKNKSSLLTMTQGLSNDYDATPVTCRWVGKLNANDTIQFLDMGASAPIEGSHFAIRFIKP
ncbi:hypothetical protein LDV99_002751 [Vibrio parahaemolyticus]|nr:hypothetical protein [Vibrio parahaemolyticus]